MTRLPITVLGMLLLGLVAPLQAAGLKQVDFDPKKALSQPKFYVGSEVCKSCHLEHHDAWERTLHSRMLVDVSTNADALVTDIDPVRIRADLEKIAAKLKVPVDEVYIPRAEEIKFTIGSQWKQRYLIERDGELYIAPIQFNIDSGQWVNYHEKDWLDRPWLDKCGGCHATGVDVKARNFVEPGVGCESCHGPGSVHAALPRSEIYKKRDSIVNPSKLTGGVAVQVCGSCHNRGKATQAKASWPVGYRPGKALETYYKSTSFESGDVKHVYANEFAKGHHQQYIDWKQSKHADEGVTCVSCHFVHKLGSPVGSRGQTDEAWSKQCLQCHEPINRVGAHSIHSFGNCVGCHMPKIAKSAESGDIHSHVFVALLPKDTIEDPRVPNSCQTCHKHKDEDLQDLQQRYDALVKWPKPQGPVVDLKP